MSGPPTPFTPNLGGPNPNPPIHMWMGDVPPPNLNTYVHPEVPTGKLTQP